MGLAAAYLQSPRLIMHAWTTSFPWYRSCITKRAADGPTSRETSRAQATSSPASAASAAVIERWGR